MVDRHIAAQYSGDATTREGNSVSLRDIADPKRLGSAPACRFRLHFPLDKSRPGLIAYNCGHDVDILS